jgi:hypothetical protein
LYMSLSVAGLPWVSIQRVEGAEVDTLRGFRVDVLESLGRTPSSAA